MPSWLAAALLFLEAESYYHFLQKRTFCGRDPRQELAAGCMYQRTHRGFSLIFELHFKLQNKNYKLEHNSVKSPTYDVVSGVCGWFMPCISRVSGPFKTVVSFFLTCYECLIRALYLAVLFVSVLLLKVEFMDLICTVKIIHFFIILSFVELCS